MSVTATKTEYSSNTVEELIINMMVINMRKGYIVEWDDDDEEKTIGELCELITKLGHHVYVIDPRIRDPERDLDRFITIVVNVKTPREAIDLVLKKHSLDKNEVEVFVSMIVKGEFVIEHYGEWGKNGSLKED